MLEQPEVQTQTLHKTPVQPLSTSNQAVTEASQDSRNMALIAWVGAIFFGFIPPLILMLMKPEDDFVQRHSKESLNLALTSLLIYMVCIFTAFLIIPIFLMAIVGIANFIFCVMAAVTASKGDDYRVPMPMLRLIK